jgi:hypothetical protein
VDLGLGGGMFYDTYASKRNYPIQQFRAFWSATKPYAELTKSRSLIHKSVAAAVYELVDFLGAERKPVPGEVFGMLDAERLECLLFKEYDPYFVGDEPPVCDARQLCLRSEAILLQTESGSRFLLASGGGHCLVSWLFGHLPKA